MIITNFKITKIFTGVKINNQTKVESSDQKNKDQFTKVSKILINMKFFTIFPIVVQIHRKLN